MKLYKYKYALTKSLIYGFTPTSLAFPGAAKTSSHFNATKVHASKIT